MPINEQQKFDLFKQREHGRLNEDKYDLFKQRENQVESNNFNQDKYNLYNERDLVSDSKIMD